MYASVVSFSPFFAIRLDRLAILASSSFLWFDSIEYLHLTPVFALQQVCGHQEPNL